MLCPFYFTEQKSHFETRSSFSGAVGFPALTNQWKHVKTPQFTEPQQTGELWKQKTNWILWWDYFDDLLKIEFLFSTFKQKNVNLNTFPRQLRKLNPIESSRTATECDETFLLMILLSFSSSRNTEWVDWQTEKKHNWSLICSLILPESQDDDGRPPKPSGRFKSWWI